MPSKGWTTEMEIDFIKRLGTWTTHAVAHKPLVDAYARALRHRSRWDGMDYRRIMAAVDKELG